jgi:alpha-galactosidase
MIGAGSVMFAKKLVGDILQFPELSECEICLMDINPQRLRIAEAMTQKSVEALRLAQWSQQQPTAPRLSVARIT